MLTIDDVRKIVNLPVEPSLVDEEKVNRVVAFRNDLIPFLDNLNLFTIDFINSVDEIFRRWYSLELNPWLKEKCIVGLMGGYSVGKSTLMNVLLGNTDELPTGINPVTSLPTYIAYGRNSKHYIIDKDQNMRVIPSDLFAKFSHEESENFPFRKIFEHTVLYKNYDFLNKMSFLDTPGITADSPYDFQTTADAASKCDIVLWLVKAPAGAITKFEIDFMKQYLSGKKLYLVITYADRVADVGKIMNVISQQLSNEAIKVENMFLFATRTTPRVDVNKNTDAMYHMFQYEASIHKKFHPQALLEEQLAFVKKTLDKRFKETNDEKRKAENACREYEQEITRIHNSLIDNTNAVKYIIDTMCDTINERCAGAMFCGGASSQLIDNFNEEVRRFNAMVQSLNNFDPDQMVSYGQLSSYLDRLKELVDEYTNSRNTCIKLINNSRNILV